MTPRRRLTGNAAAPAPPAPRGSPLSRASPATSAAPRPGCSGSNKHAPAIPCRHARTRMCAPHTCVHAWREPAPLPAGTRWTPSPCPAQAEPGAMLRPPQPRGKLMPIITKAPKLPAPNPCVQRVRAQRYAPFAAAAPLRQPRSAEAGAEHHHHHPPAGFSRPFRQRRRRPLPPASFRTRSIKHSRRGCSRNTNWDRPPKEEQGQNTAVAAHDLFLPLFAALGKINKMR